MAKRRKRRERAPVETASYTDDEGNVLVLRKELSPGTLRKLGERTGGAATSLDDAERRREEMLFERLAVSWEIAGLPLDDQSMLLGRYRMADEPTRRWVRRTIARHVAAHIPELARG